MHKRMGFFDRNFHLLVGCVCCLAFSVACKEEPVEWRGNPEPDKRSALGFKGEPCDKWREVILETDIGGHETYGFHPVQTTEWAFNGSGQLTQLRISYSGRYEQLLEYEYNDHGQLIDSQNGEPNGQKFGHTVTTYFPNGLIAETQFFNGQKRLKKRCQYAYDAQSRLLTVKEIEYLRDESDTRKFSVKTMEYVYADYDRHQVITKFDGALNNTAWYAYGHLDSSVEASGIKTLCYYDSKDRLTQFKRVDASNRPLEKTEYVLDNQGRHTLEVHFGEDLAWESDIRQHFDSLGYLADRLERYRIPAEDPAVVADTVAYRQDFYEFQYPQYDAYQNWLTMLEIKNGKTIRKRVRTSCKARGS